MLWKICRSEARLQKLGTQLSTYLLGNEGNDREADIEIVSDEEKNGRNLRSTSELQNELHNTSSVSRKRHYVEQQYTTKESVQDGTYTSLFKLVLGKSVVKFIHLFQPWEEEVKKISWRMGRVLLLVGIGFLRNHFPKRKVECGTRKTQWTSPHRRKTLGKEEGFLLAPHLAIR